jgi:hypothetical protein
MSSTHTFLTDGITRCAACGDPAHASETDDYDHCEACRAGLERFRASARAGSVDDDKPGWTYEGGAWLLDTEDGTGNVLLVLGNQQWILPRDEAEARLYDWAVSEGVAS